MPHVAFRSRRVIAIVLTVITALLPCVTTYGQVDPVQVVKGVITLIQLYDSMSGQKGGGKVDLSEINAHLSEISAQMQQVLQELTRLGAKIDSANDEQARQHVVAVINQVTSKYAALVDGPAKIPRGCDLLAE